MESESIPALLTVIPASDTGMPAYGLTEGLLLLFVMLVISAIFAAYQSACFALKADEKTLLQELKSARSVKVLRLLSDGEKLIATTLLVTLLINLLIILDLLFILNQFPAFSLLTLTGICLQAVAIFLVVSVFAKIIPGIYGQKNSLMFIMLAVYPVIFASIVLTPFTFLLVRFNALIDYSIIRSRSNLSIDELSEALDHSKDVKTEDRKILMGIVNFSNIEISDIMRPRMDVVSAETDISFSKLIQIVNESGYSRIPVFTDTFDNIKGILYVKDLLPFVGEKEDYNWQGLIRPAYFVPETKKIKDLLQEFLDKKIHMAIVVDEYGGTEGIVTLEDVLEEIVGEITDESDEVESFYSRIDDYNYIFDGKILLNDFFKIIHLPEEMFESVRGDADTLAGLILEIKGEIPPANETITLKNFSFTILSVDERRIKKVKFTIDKKLKVR